VPKDNAPEGVEAGTQVGRPAVFRIASRSEQHPFLPIGYARRIRYVDLHPPTVGGCEPGANTDCRWGSAMG
jgi:hypothetical protein